jgi:dTDP-4-dehydrorhamnose reductase
MSYVLLGGSGYIGQAFAGELRRREQPFVSISRKEIDYSRFDVLLDFLRRTHPSFLINAAGYSGRPNVDACEVARAETIQGNILLAQTVSHACAISKVPWGHVSSGCIYTGAKIVQGGAVRIERDLTSPDVRKETVNDAQIVHGFAEGDTPNFTFSAPPCSFYSGTKALAEEAISGVGECYLWRLRIPFDHIDHSKNYLSKLQRYSKVYDNTNSLSHRADFVSACLDLWERRSSFGIYNVTNPGFVTAREVVSMIEEYLKPGRRFEFWSNDAEFYTVAAKAPRSNCVLDVSKLLASGVKMRSVNEALRDSLMNWVSGGA